MTKYIVFKPKGFWNISKMILGLIILGEISINFEVFRNKLIEILKKETENE